MQYENSKWKSLILILLVKNCNCLSQVFAPTTPMFIFIQMSAIEMMQCSITQWLRASCMQWKQYNVIQVTRLRVLISGLEVGGVEILTTAAAAAGTASKPRLRSLTPSAEKLRVSTLQQQVKVVANGNESSKDQVRLLNSNNLCVSIYGHTIPICMASKTSIKIRQ